MRIASLTVSLPLAVAVVGCSDVECTKYEYKIADICYPRRDAGTAGQGGDAVGEGGARDAGGADPTDASLDAPSSRDASAPEASTESTAPHERDAMSVDAPVVDARVAEMPGVDAGESQPGADAGVSCVGGGQTEVCDGKDNDCDGQVDEGVKNACGACGPVPAEECDGIDNDCNGQIDDDVGTAWYRDCDGDGFAVNAVGKVEGCKKPAPASDCAGWTNRDPADPAQQDCDDTAAQRFPGAGFGLVTKSSGDLNCDGKVELHPEFVASDSELYGPSTPFRLCADRTQCGCLEVATRFEGFKGLQGGRAVADSAIPFYPVDGLLPPCADDLGDAQWAIMMLSRADCREAMAADGATIIVRILCR